jgi:hypothetical protein
MLLLDGVIREKGRYPNTGWNSITSVTTLVNPNIADPVTFVDDEIVAGPDWTGAELVIRLDRCHHVYYLLLIIYPRDYC